MSLQDVGKYEQEKEQNEERIELRQQVAQPSRNCHHNQQRKSAQYTQSIPHDQELWQRVSATVVPTPSEVPQQDTMLQHHWNSSIVNQSQAKEVAYDLLCLCQSWEMKVKQPKRRNHISSQSIPALR